MFRLLLCTLLIPSVWGQVPDVYDSFSTARKGVFVAAPGQWDSLIRERGWILKEGHTWKLWYTGYRGDDTSANKMKLGYATSRDGINWQRHSADPIYDDHWVEDMMVVRRGDTLFMFAEGAGDQAHLLRSKDGISWERLGPLDVRSTNGSPIEAGPYGTPTAWFEDGTWYLFYERRDAGIWLATSRDMKTWTNISDEPLITPGPDKYDSLMIAMNQIVKLNGRYYAVMHGTGSPQKPRDWCTYLAYSDDLKIWQKCMEGPMLPVEDNVSSGVLVRDGEQFRLYTMHGRVDLHLPQKSARVRKRH